MLFKFQHHFYTSIAIPLINMELNNLFYFSCIFFAIGILLLFFVTTPIDINPNIKEGEINNNPIQKILYNIWFSFMLLGITLFILWIILGEFLECQQ